MVPIGFIFLFQLFGDTVCIAVFYPFLFDTT